MPDVESSVAAHLYRIAQEAITNAVKHGPAHRVDIELRGQGRGLELAISDDGEAGFDPEHHERGHGLRIMEYRARSIGARLAFERGPRGSGLCVICSLPPA